MGLLSDAKDFVSDTFQASSPPLPLSKLKGKKGNRVSVTDKYGTSQGKSVLDDGITHGILNPYMVWIQGHDWLGDVGIDGILKGPFEVPVSATWEPMLPQFAKDIAGAITGPLAGASRAVASATSGSMVGGVAAVGAGVMGGIDNFISGDGVSALNQATSGLFGESLTNPAWFQLMWKGASPMVFTLDMDFVTINDPEKDVIDPVSKLQKFILPTFKDGTLRAPGYHPIQGFAGVGQAISSHGSSGLGRLSDKYGSAYKLDVHVGNTCRFNNVVITAVNARYNTMPSVKNKKFHTVSCSVQFAAQQVLVKDNIDEIYRRKNYSYAANDPITSTEQQFSDVKRRASGEVSSLVSGAKSAVSNAVSGVENRVSSVLGL